MDRLPDQAQGNLGDHAPSGDIGDAELRSFVQRADDVGDLSTVTALSAFVRQMARYPRLSVEDQLRLVEECQRARAATVALAQGGLTKADERRARAAAARGDAAMTQLLGSTIRLVILIVRENITRRYGKQRALDLAPDLVSECMAALMKAVYIFDPERVPSFSAYAARVVRDTVRMSLSNDETSVRIPSSWSRVRRIASKRIPNLTIELGRTPTSEEIHEAIYEKCLQWAGEHLSAEENKLPPARRQELMIAKLRKQGMLGALERLDEVLAIGRPVRSLDLTMGNGSTATVGDMVAQSVPDATFDAVELDELRVAIESALATLPSRDQEIIRLRFDLDRTGEEWTYSRIAQKFGITAERIRQIEHGALEKLSLPHVGPGGLAAFLPTYTDEAA